MISTANTENDFFLKVRKKGLLLSDGLLSTIVNLKLDLIKVHQLCHQENLIFVI